MGNLMGFEGALKSGDIRRTPDGKCVAVVDLIMHMTGKNEKGARDLATRLKGKYLELVSFFEIYPFGRYRPSEVVNAEGAVRLIMVLPGKQAANFRQSAARLICRYLSADITLADDILQRNQNPEDAKWLAERAQGVAVRHELTDTIKDHGGQKRTYIEVSDLNNVAVTGMPAREIKQIRKVKSTRDSFTVGELAAMSLTENLEAANIDNKAARGHSEIMEAVSEVTADIGSLMSKYRKKETLAQATTL